MIYQIVKNLLHGLIIHKSLKMGIQILTLVPWYIYNKTKKTVSSFA